MKYFIVLFVFGMSCRNTIARVLDSPVLYELERRLVRLETRQFSQSKNLEHRMLQLETQLGTQKGEERLESSPVNPNFYEIIKKETSSEGISFLQRLEKVEKIWEELEEQLAKLSSKYNSLHERLSAMENQLEEEPINSTFNQIIKTLINESEKPESADGKMDESTSDDEEHPNYEKEESQIGDAIKEWEFQRIGKKYYYIENNEKKSWFGALGKCRELSSHLVSLQDEEEWSALKEALEPDHSYWVDSNDRVEENSYRSYTTSELAPFLKWDDNEPNSPLGAIDCVELRADHEYKMNDVSCLAQKYYICESYDIDQLLTPRQLAQTCKTKVCLKTVADVAAEIDRRKI